MIKHIVHNELDAVIKDTAAITGSIKRTMEQCNITLLTQNMINYFRSHEYCLTGMMLSIQDIKVFSPHPCDRVTHLPILHVKTNIIQPFITSIKSGMIAIYERLATEIQNMINEVIDNPDLIVDDGRSKTYDFIYSVWKQVNSQLFVY